MLAFDTETTGLLRPSATDLYLQPYIIEIYVCKFDDEFTVVDSFHSLVKPPVPISEEITKITGIDNEMVRNAPTFIGIYHDLCDFFAGEKTIFAHNCTFDVNMLRNELARHGLQYKFPWPQEHICTVEASMPILNKRIKLLDLYKMATGKEMENAHRAEDDVRAMVKCIEWLYGEELL